MISSPKIRHTLFPEIVVIVIINIMTPIMDESIDDTKTETVYGVKNIEFSAQDSFAVTGLKSITLTSDDNLLLDVYILHKDDYENQYYSKRLNIYESESKDILRLNYKRDDFLPYGDYVLYIDAKDQTANVTYTLEKSVSSTFVLYLTIFPIIFAAMNAIWAVYLWPLKKRYEKTSIYE